MAARALRIIFKHARMLHGAREGRVDAKEQGGQKGSQRMDGFLNVHLVGDCMDVRKEKHY
jgi:hypothetical protein